jgi:hypothetical protein
MYEDQSQNHQIQYAKAILAPYSQFMPKEIKYWGHYGRVFYIIQMCNTLNFIERAKEANQWVHGGGMRIKERLKNIKYYVGILTFTHVPIITKILLGN